MKKTIATRTKAVIYARVSSKEQEAEGFSVDAQLRLLRAYAAEKQVDIVKEFTEAETAKQSGRKAFGSMLKFLENSPGHVIFVEKVDRLYRNFADYVKVDHLGVELHFVKDGMVIGESSKSQDKFMHGIRVLMAKNYVDNLSEEIRKGLNEKAAQGIYPTHAPLGYLNTIEPGTKRKTIVPDPARAHLLKEMFERYASGLESYDTLIKWAHSNGLTTKKGKPLVRTSIEKILKHPAYCGIIRWQGKESVGVHDPLVTLKVWKRVQDVREGRATNTGFGGKDFAYRGLVRCACGELLTGELKKGIYVYYHCTGRKREICGRPYISETKITEAFCCLLRQLQIPEFAMSWISEGLAQADMDRHARRAVHERDLAKSIASIERRLEQLYLDKLSGDIALDFYRSTRTKWESEGNDLKIQLAAIDRVGTASVDQTMRLFELASTAHSRFKNANPNQKRELIGYLCSNSVWRDGKLEVELHEFFDLMLNTVISEIPQEGESTDKAVVFAKSVDWWRIGGSNP